jgi:hypothetical protein
MLKINNAQKATERSSRMPVEAMKDMILRDIQFLELVMNEIPDEMRGAEFAVLIQRRMVDLFKVLLAQ